MTNIQRTILWATLVAACFLPGCTSSPFASRPHTQRSQVGRGPNPKAVSHTDEGATLKQSGDLQAALASFRKALDADARHVPAHLGVGDVYQLLGDYEQAATSYETAKTINPTSFEANYKLAVMQQLLDRIRDSISNYLGALTINPDSFEANSNLAAAYGQIGESRLALPYAERAVTINPESQQAHLNLASIYSALGRNEEAIESSRFAADRGDLPPASAIALVNAMIRINAYERAVNTLQALLRQDRDNARFLERLGYIRFRMSEYEESLDAYEASLRLAPDDPAALNGLGVNLMAQYLQSGRRDTKLRQRAVESWQHSVRVSPGQGRIIDLISRYQNL